MDYHAHTHTHTHTHTHIYIYIYMRGTRGAMVIIVGNRLGDTSSNPVLYTHNTTIRIKYMIHAKHNQT